MKILILNAGREHTLGSAYETGFTQIGCSPTFLDPSEFLTRNCLWRNRYTRRILEEALIDEGSRDLLAEILKLRADVIWVGKGDWALPGLWGAIRALCPSTTLVCFNGDDPITTFSRGGNRPWVTKSIPYFDIYCTYKKSIVEDLYRHGAKQVLVLPFAWDPLCHPTQPVPDFFDFDISFIGNGDPYRMQWLTAILKQGKLDNAKVVVCGNWPAKNKREIPTVIWHDEVLGSQMASIVAGSKLSLNLLRLQNEGAHNMRTFEVPGCGGVMASQWSEDQRLFFPDDRAAIYFTDPKEAAIKISAVLEDRGRLASMRRMALDIVKEHTYADRARVLLDAIVANKKMVSA